MKFPDMSGKNFAKLKFIGFFGGSVILCVIILSSFWPAGSSTPPQELNEVQSFDISGAQQLLEVNQLLHSKWIQLEQLYDEQSMSLIDPSKTNSTTAKQITENELAYVKILDSVAAINSTSSSVEKIDSVVNTYRASLQNKQALNNNLNELASKNGGSIISSNVENGKIDDKKLINLQHDLVAKNDIITKLQNEASAGSKAKNSLTANEQKLRELQIDLQSKTEMISKLQTEAGVASTLKKTLSVNDQKLIQLQGDLKSKTDMIAKLQGQVNEVASKNTGLSANEQKLRQMQNDLQSKNEMISKLQGQLTAVSAKSSTPSTNEQKVRQLQTDVQVKTEMITKLQNQLKQGSVKANGTVDEKKLNDLQKELQSKTSTIAKLQNQLNTMPAKSSIVTSQSLSEVKKMADELEFLKWALRSEVSSNHTLTADIDKLKQTNSNLTNQLKGK